MSARKSLRTSPTLILDCRRDPFINGLFADIPDAVCSVMVIPFRISDGSLSYLYVDRLAQDNRLNPFNQIELNFAVGFTDLIAFKWTEFQKLQLQEDNLRLKSQLQKQAAFPAIITQNPQMLDMLSQGSAGRRFEHCYRYRRRDRVGQGSAGSRYSL